MVHSKITFSYIFCLDDIIPHFLVFASANRAKILVHFARTLYLESFSLYSLNDIPVADLNAFRRSESSE